MLKVDCGETCVMCCLYTSYCKGGFWRELHLMLFVYIILLKAVLKRPTFGAVCAHQNFKVAFGET